MENNTLVLGKYKLKNSRDNGHDSELFKWFRECVHVCVHRCLCAHVCMHVRECVHVERGRGKDERKTTANI